jgi:hypothetical protein
MKPQKGTKWSSVKIFVPFCGCLLLLAGSVYASNEADLRNAERFFSYWQYIRSFEFLTRKHSALARKTRNSLEEGRILNDLAYLHSSTATPMKF